MGNNVNSKLMASAISPLNWKDMPAEAKEKFIVREILTHSEDQHRQLLITLSRFKQYDSRNIVKLVDSHTVQSNNLCSIMNYIYAVLEKPRHSLSNYMAAKKASSDQVLRIIADVVKAISFLKKEDNDIDRIKEEMIFIEEEEGGEITAKIMNPFFKDSGYEGE
jgi:serine/threonine protein kinase